jgi:hypothetical protein
MDSERLLELVERVEKAGSARYALDCEIAAALDIECRAAPKCYTSSVDDALTLIPEGAGWDVGKPRKSFYVARCGLKLSKAATPALALTAAALRARASMESSQ